MLSQVTVYFKKCRLIYWVKARLHRRFLSQQLFAKSHQVSNMFETPAILLRQIALKIATCLHMRFWSYNFSATKIACVNGPLHSWVTEYLFFSLALLSVCEGWSVLSIQLYRQRLFHNSTKAHATMLIGIMGNNSLAPRGWSSRCLARKKKNVWIHVFVLLPSLTPKYLSAL